MSDSPSAELTCANPECKVKETGKCLEGFQNIQECPHLRSVAKKPGTPPPTVPVEVENHDDVDGSDSTNVQKELDTHINSGYALRIDEAEAVLRSQRTKVISVLGPIGCGKTTLGLSLYEAFHDESFGQYSFGGSLTLRSFEERCHLARIESGGALPDTSRTPIGDGLRFMHLSVCSAPLGKRDILISDRSGEFYTSLVQGLENDADLPEIKRADKVFLLVDGERLLSDSRHATKTHTIMTIETLLNLGVVGPNHRLGLLLTKYDIVFDSSEKNRAITDFKSLVTKVTEKFGRRVQNINSFYVASRSNSSNVESRYGLLEVLHDAIAIDTIQEFHAPATSLPNRHFHRFTSMQGR